MCERHIEVVEEIGYSSWRISAPEKRFTENHDMQNIFSLEWVNLDLVDCIIIFASYCDRYLNANNVLDIALVDLIEILSGFRLYIFTNLHQNGNNFDFEGKPVIFDFLQSCHKNCFISKIKF